MIRLAKLDPNERLLVVSPVNRYKVVGPGWVVLGPRQRVLTRLGIGPKAQSFQFKEVRTAENIAMNVTVQTIYRVDPKFLGHDLLPRIAGLNDGGWRGALKWQTEYVLRLLIAQYSWRQLAQEKIQKRLERQFTQTLVTRLSIIGLNVFTVCLVKTELPVDLQKTLIQAERDGIEAQGRAKVLERYSEIFGDNLSKAMPLIIQWELMNTIHKDGRPHVFLTSESLSSQPTLPTNQTNGTAHLPLLHMQLPMQ